MIITDDSGAPIGAYYADGTAVIGNTVTEVQNPISRSVVRLDPPLSLDELNEFMEAFRQFCDDAWTLPTRRDPSRVDPRRILDGTEPVDTMEDYARRLVWEHGPYAAQDAIMRTSDAYWRAQGFPVPAPGPYTAPPSPILPIPVDTVDDDRPQPRTFPYAVGGVLGTWGSNLPVDIAPDGPAPVDDTGN